MENKSAVGIRVLGWFFLVYSITLLFYGVQQFLITILYSYPSPFLIKTFQDICYDLLTLHFSYTAGFLLTILFYTTMFISSVGILNQKRWAFNLLLFSLIADILKRVIGIIFITQTISSLFITEMLFLIYLAVYLSRFKAK